VLSAAALSTWGWRIPFLLGIGVGALGLWLRRRLPDVPAATDAEGRAPLLEALRNERTTIVRLMLLCLASGPVFYILFVYIVSYVQMIDGVAPAAALDVNTISMVMLIAALLVGGALSDRLGRKPLAVGAALGLLVLAWPLFRLLHDPSFAPMLATQLTFATLLGLYTGQLPAMLVESLPGKVRCSALAFSYNVVVGLCGGFTPMVRYLAGPPHGCRHGSRDDHHARRGAPSPGALAATGDRGTAAALTGQGGPPGCPAPPVAAPPAGEDGSD
jgi:MFS transporter, MHS family, proline/betaine transporter